MSEKMIRMLLGPVPAGIVPFGRGLFDRWRYTYTYGDLKVESRFLFKFSAIADAVDTAHRLEEQGEHVSLLIMGRDGRFKEERTYPRSADPDRTPG